MLHLFEAGVFIEETKMVAADLHRELMELRNYNYPSAFQPMNKLKGSHPNSTMVCEEDTFIELGHPVTDSVCIGLMTKRSDLIIDNRVTVLGGELQDLPKGRYSIALMAMVEAFDPNESCRRLLERKLSVGDFPEGCMVRALSDRIWVRLTQGVLNRGFSLGDMGWRLISEIKKEKDRFNKVEVLFVVTRENHVKRLRSVAERLAEKNMSQVKANFMNREDCDSALDCTECSDTDVCRVFKDAVMIKGKKGRAS